MPTPLTSSQYAASLGPRDFWRLEETVGDFLKTAPGEYDATPGTGIGNRGQAFVCNGINLTVGSSEGVQDYFQSQRPFDGMLYRNNFSFEQMCRPRDNDVGVDGNSGRVIVSTPYGGDPPDPYTGQPQGFGLGLKVSTKVIQIALWRNFYINGNLNNGINTDSHLITRYYGGPELAYDTPVHVMVVVIEAPAGTVRVKLFVNGEYAANLSGTYVETVGFVGSAFLTSGVNFGWFVSWPDYSRRHRGIFEYYHGHPFIGHLDECIWYDRPLTPTEIANRYDSIQATLAATAPGAFTSPVGGASFDAGSDINVAWGAAVGATGYHLEVFLDGVWVEVGQTVAPNAVYTTPLWDYSGVRFRVRPLYGDYAPESCVDVTTLSGEFSIVFSVDTAAPRPVIPRPEPGIVPVEELALIPELRQGPLETQRDLASAHNYSLDKVNELVRAVNSIINHLR